ncbi:MAG: prolyl-tRNA synthetase associated domain-containing protein [Bacteroidetes bacterium]|nr:prolyl-tRNA synthetase associated domain-containing protein [Bacteroidota bacterium]
MDRKESVFKVLAELNITYVLTNHPPVPTVEEAAKYWVDLDAAHCKNLFFRNHKGDKHYLVLLDFRQSLFIKDLEHRLKQGKISFASAERMDKYLGLKAGSVSPFGLIHDLENHVHVFIDKNLEHVEKISFHPNDNTATLVLSLKDFIKFLEWSGNNYEFINLYD